MDMINMKFAQGGSTVSVEVPAGTTLLEAAHSNGIALEGACEGSLACSTCHVVLEQATYDAVLASQAVADEENDMLETAFGLTATSRLGCQVIATEKLQGASVRIPSNTRNTA
ncbi:2Fe-2S iron-sulfur cluster-binding protein [Streptomyces sp. NPDC051366]|uniref:2Fe-2S iron-sulfur cluster-binding protein n=1 Tax=Streptomyces sp. NPDC051366 TaxID=3365652 RepID=UPI0037BC4CA0